MRISFAVGERTCFAGLILLLMFGSCRHRGAAEFIKVNDPIIALTHVRVIDGTPWASTGNDPRTGLIVMWQ